MYCFATCNDGNVIWYKEPGDSVKAELKIVFVILYVPGPPLKSMDGPGSLVRAKFN